jgi:hypothetical protein
MSPWNRWLAGAHADRPGKFHEAGRSVERSFDNPRDCGKNSDRRGKSRSNAVDNDNVIAVRHLFTPRPNEIPLR